MTVKDLETALKEYLLACYGHDKVGTAQLKEVRQAFLSGIHWRDQKEMSPGKCEDAIRQLLVFDRERN